MSDSSRPFAITLDVGTSLTNETGSWRTQRPVYVDRLPPCNNICPAGENIQAWLYLAEEGDYEGAWQEILKHNPMPAVMGRACYHTCEGACNRGAVDEAVGIHAVERFLGDLANKHGWMPDYEAEPSGKKVLVIGAGPAGLACAYHLTRMGHAVTIADASDKAGGLLRYGIPRYRLPNEVLDGDIKRIEKMGVSFQMNTYIEDMLKAKEAGGYDALFVAVGAQRCPHPGHSCHDGGYCAVVNSSRMCARQFSKIVPMAVNLSLGWHGSHLLRRNVRHGCGALCRSSRCGSQMGGAGEPGTDAGA
jgi:hypothetical protein